MKKRNKEKIIRHTTECGSIILTFFGKDHKEEMIFKSDEEYQRFLYHWRWTMQYVVTAINNLTGEREAISSPRSLSLTTALMEKHKRSCRYKRHQPWSNYLVEPIDKYQSLKNENNETR